MNKSEPRPDTHGLGKAHLSASRWGLAVAVLLVCGVGLLSVVTLLELMRQNSINRRYVPVGEIHFNNTAPADIRPPAPPNPGNVLRVAIAPVVSPERSLEIYQDFVMYLGKKTGRTVRYLQRDTYAEVNELVRYGLCDLAFVCTYAFVRGEREFGMELLAIPRIKGKLTYQSYVIVPVDSEAESLLDLKGKRFASADILSNTGWLFPATWLAKHGQDANTFFAEHVISGSHDRSILAVASKFVDGAAVDSLVYEQMTAEDPELAKRVKIILRSEPFGMPPLVVPPQLDPQLKQQLQAVLFQAHMDPEGQKLLQSLGIDRFEPPDPSLYDSVRQAAAMWEKLQ